MTNQKTLTAEQRDALGKLIDNAWDAYIDVRHLTLDELEEKYPHALTENDKTKDLRHCRHVVKLYLRDRNV